MVQYRKAPGLQTRWSCRRPSPTPTLSIPSSASPLFLTWRRGDSSAEAIFLYSRVIQKTGLIKSINLNSLFLPALWRLFFFSPGLISPCSLSGLPCRHSCKRHLATLFLSAGISFSSPLSSPSLCDRLSFLLNWWYGSAPSFFFFSFWKCDDFSLFGLTFTFP